MENELFYVWCLEECSLMVNTQQLLFVISARYQLVLAAGLCAYSTGEIYYLFLQIFTDLVA